MARKYLQRSLNDFVNKVKEKSVHKISSPALFGF